MGPTWVLSAPVGPHVGPMNLGIKEHDFTYHYNVRMIETDQFRNEFNYIKSFRL